MRLDFLPKKYTIALINCNLDMLYEIRLRENFPVLLSVGKDKFFLSKSGYTVLETCGIVCTSEDIKEIIRNVTEYSTYAFNEKIRRGYITTEDGIRIGLAGEFVYDKGGISWYSDFVYHGLSTSFINFAS